MSEQRERWLTLRQARELLADADMQVSTQTIRNWGESRRLEMRKTAGGHRRFAESSVRRVIAAWRGEAEVEDSPASPAAE